MEIETQTAAEPSVLTQSNNNDRTGNEIEIIQSDERRRSSKGNKKYIWHSESVSFTKHRKLLLFLVVRHFEMSIFYFNR